MEQEKIPAITLENKIEKPINPNSIGELISLGKDLLTGPDKVYRSVATREAIDDIENSGVVRNKQSAGLVEKSRWGERVFWSRGGDGKYHPVPANGYVIEAPFSVAQERVVKKEDVSAIYTKNENDEVLDILKQTIQNEVVSEQLEAEKRKREDLDRLAQIRKDLGIE